MTDQAEALELAAQWHDRNAAGCLEISKDDPRIAADIRERALIATKHHAGSAASLRLAATEIRRKSLPC